MAQAINLWRLFPTEIEGDLSLHHHRSIREWHRREMRSDELLILLDILPDRSRFKGAQRALPWRHLGVRYEWCQAEYREARLIKEIASQRGEYDITGLLSPAEKAVALQEQQVKSDQLERARTLLRIQAGFDY